jgi:hypothetical protein
MKTTHHLLFFVGLVAPLASAFSQSSPPPAPPPPPINHEYDFWIGEWNVYANGTDKLIGESRVESIASGYALLENWTASPEFGQHNGKSLNSYNRHTGQWQQYWTDSNGKTTEYKGGMEGGKMVMIAESFTPKGTRYLQRGTWAPNPDGTVRQQFEISTDEGKTWQPSFDALYRRRPAR